MLSLIVVIHKKIASVFVFLLQLWARVYRDNRYHAAVDTDNGVEAMNKTLKYNYLPKGKNITLSHLVTILVEEFLPEMLQKYQKENFAMSESYRSYNEFVPEYLKGWPKSVVLHCLSRIRKAERFTKESVEQINESSQFIVKSASGKEHALNFTNDENNPECTCKDWICWHIPCKHFFAVFNHFPNWGWTKLPKKYLENEYLTADSAILTDPSDAGSSPPTSTLSNSPTQGDLDGGETMGYTDELLRAVSTISCTTLLLHVHVQGIR